MAWNNLYFIGKKDQRERRIVIKGEDEKRRIFAECHNSLCGGHAGRDKERYYWPRFYADTVTTVRSILSLLYVHKLWYGTNETNDDENKFNKEFKFDTTCKD